MSVAEAYRDWMETNGIATSGQDLYLSKAPIGSTAYWITASGGSTGERYPNGGGTVNTAISVYYRDPDPKKVYDNLEALRDETECAGCLDLEGYTVISIYTTGPFADQDLDSEDRTVGLLEVTLQLKKKDC